MFSGDEHRLNKMIRLKSWGSTNQMWMVILFGRGYYNIETSKRDRKGCEFATCFETELRFLPFVVAGCFIICIRIREHQPVLEGAKNIKKPVASGGDLPTFGG